VTLNVVGGTDRRLRLLIVDDHAFFRRGIREILNEEEDMEVVAEASSGEQAIKLVRELQADGLDLMLMDIDMPGLDGISATAQIAAEFPDMPVVMMTVSSLDRDLFEALRVGAVGFLSKSLSPDALARALRGFRRGESLPMSSDVAQKVLGYFKGAPVEPQPPSVETQRRAGSTRVDRTRGARPRDRRALDRDRKHGQKARAEHLAQTACPQSSRGSGAPARHAAGGLSRRRGKLNYLPTIASYRPCSSSSEKK